MHSFKVARLCLDDKLGKKFLSDVRVNMVIYWTYMVMEKSFNQSLVSVCKFHVLSMSGSIHLWEEKYSCLRNFLSVKWLDCVKELLAVLAILLSLYGDVCAHDVAGGGNWVGYKWAGCSLKFYCGQYTISEMNRVAFSISRFFGAELSHLFFTSFYFLTSD